MPLEVAAIPEDDPRRAKNSSSSSVNFLSLGRYPEVVVITPPVARLLAKEAMTELDAAAAVVDDEVGGKD